jgi:cation transport ATPase
MTAKPPTSRNGLGLPAIDQEGQFYRSAVRLTRVYATFSPTMVGLLLAKKTRFGRFIPLPDALPDDFSLRSLVGNGAADKPGDAAQPTANGALNGASHLPLPAVPATNGAPAPAASAPAAAAPVRTTHARSVLYEIAHQTPGRIRLTIPRLEHDAKFAQRLAEAALALPDVSQARVSAASRSLVVSYRYRTLDARRQAAILPQVVECIRAAAGTDQVHQMHRVASGDEPEGPPPVELATRMALPAASLGLSAGMAAGLAVPPLLMGGLVLLAARPIFVRAVEGWRSERRLTVEVLDATTITLMTAQASFLAPAVIVGIIEGGQAARDWSAGRRRPLTLDRLLPPEQQVQVVSAVGPVRRSWAELSSGDELTLRAGDVVPVDGLVLHGQALVDQQRLTGDRWPTPCSAGDLVWAGSRLLEGRLVVLAQQTGHATAVGQAMTALEAAPQRDRRISNYARMVGNWAVVPTLLMGGAVFAATGNLVRATGIVNMDLGTGMRVSSPLAYFVARRQAAQRGIQIRNGRGLEQLALADALLMDRSALWHSAPDAIESLAGLGLQPRLLASNGNGSATGANGAAPHAYGELTPQQKLGAVQALQAEGRRVAVLGAGMNDVAAMAQADVAIALGSAGLLARESADILLHNGLADLATAVELARHTTRLLRQDMAIVTAVNVGAIGYGALAVLPPAAPMLINNGSWVLASLNSLRPFHPGRPRVAAER